MVLPLDEFPPAMREEIIAAVAQPKAPPRWLELDGAQITSRAWYEWHMARGRNPLRSRPSLPKWLRQAVIDRDGYLCGICGGDVEPAAAHIDHIYPRSLGGKDALDNLQVAHSLCNIKKGAKV